MNARSIGLFLFAALVLQGCVSWRENRIATYSKIGDRYVVEVSAVGLAMVHDITALMKWPTTTYAQKFDLPRLDGKIDGSEIRHEPGMYGYIGTITIDHGVMRVKLAYDKYDLKRVEDIEWNGTYTLAEKKPNKALEPTPTAVTPPAAQEARRL